MGKFNDLSLGRVGEYTGSDDMQANLVREGFTARMHRASEQHTLRINEAAALLGDVMQGNEDAFMIREMLHPAHEYAQMELSRRCPNLMQVRETMSVTDFAQYLTVDVLDRMLYGTWAVSQIPNRQLVKMQTLRDFRIVKRFTINGAVAPFKRAMNPAEPPEERNLTPVAPITYSPDEYQGYMSINWRAIVNDDLGIFNEMVQRLATSWNLTIWQAITQLYVDANGPHASLYNAAFTNQIIRANGASQDNPPLDFQGLIDAITVQDRILSPDGQPMVMTGSRYLWFGPNLATTAMALMAALRADISVGGGTQNAEGFPTQRLSVSPNYVTGGLIPIEDKYIRIVCTTPGVRDTMWGLTYDPSGQPRPSIEMGMLRGFDTPALYQKMPNTQRAGGGVDPTMGDFLTMDLDYKAIAVFGGTQVDGRSTVASTGQGPTSP
jgi:hypothetical protein